MEDRPPNSLLSSSKTSDSLLQVQLHPLVILTISDYVTRHTLRQQTGPIVGAILGAQNGRDITLEVAFECKLVPGKDGEALVDTDWFQDRLQQFKDVHKSPALDLVGWFTLTSPHGPEEHHLPIYKQLLQKYNESAILLAFHPSTAAGGSSKGGKLPLTIYESVYEAGSDGGDSPMHSSGEAPPLVLRFKELPYTIETGEAEMISVDFVARGGANASVTNGTSTQPPQKSTKGKSKESNAIDTPQSNGTSYETDTDILSPEDEELIATLTAKANAIQMLHQRISLLKTYLTSLPPCYLNTPPPPPSSDPSSSTSPFTPHPQISHPILRSISSLLARLPLLTPALPTEETTHDTASSLSLSQEAARERSDVALVGLLGSLGQTIKDAQEMGRKAGIVELAKGTGGGRKGGLGMSMGGPWGGGDMADMMGGGGGGARTMPEPTFMASLLAHGYEEGQ